MRRFEWVGGLSDLLDADKLFYQLRDGQGGRFYTHAGQFWDALTRETFAIADLRDPIGHSGGRRGPATSFEPGVGGLWEWLTSTVRSVFPK
jgi:hypothetical protein